MGQVQPWMILWVRSEQEYDMAVKRAITSADHLFIGTDNDIAFTIYTNDSLSAISDESTSDLLWVLRRYESEPDPAVIEKSTGSPGGISVTGVFNSDPAVNTQRIVVHLDDTDTYDATVSPAVDVPPGSYRYALKRMDAGSETILAFGSFQLLQAAAR